MTIEIIETDRAHDSKSLYVKPTSEANVEMGMRSKNDRTQSGKTVSHFQGSDTPKKPNLKWFLHDVNIQKLIEMRCADRNSIKSRVLELKGSSSATMSKNMACAIDDILNIKGSISMENQSIKEHSNVLIYEIEF